MISGGMHGLDLFSGIGGITKALEGYVKPIAYCEIDRYARGVLLSRMSSGNLPIAPIWDDVQTLYGSLLPPVDIIYGGFPCQDISVAGKQVGLDGKRSGLFFEILRLAREIRPSFIFLENVPNIRTKGLDRVVSELAEIGYDCRWDTLSAADVGANHKRERWFLLAHAQCERLERYVQSEVKSTQSGRESSGWWETEPSVGRVVDGVPKRVDRLRALGNAVVSAQAREAFERLTGLK
jgi:DNA (cytosine-5)-methyltransferase 1